jgi:hypothetical protein
MHQLRSKFTINRFRLIAVLLILKLVLFPSAVGLLLYAFYENNEELVRIALGVGLVTILLHLLVWSLAFNTRCPLCMTHVMANLKCSTHRRARKLFGSYRNRVAYGILFKGCFTCPYCHEQTSMTVRSGNRPQKSAHPYD